MPYNNPYNRSIANAMGNINERFAHLYAYSPVDGRGNPYSLEGGSSAGVLFQMGNASKRDAEDNIVNNNVASSLPPVYYYGNDEEEMKGGNGFAQGTFRDRGDGSQLGVDAVGEFKKGEGMKGGHRSGDFSEDRCNDEYRGSGMSGGNLWDDIADGLNDLGNDTKSAFEYINPFGGSHPPHQKEMKAKLLGRFLGKLMKKAHEEGKGMSGGSWWDSFKEGVADVAKFVPDLIISGLGKKKVGRPKKGGSSEADNSKVGGAILGNPDPYPVKGNSERVAGRGRPKKVCCDCGDKKCKGCGMSGGAKEIVGDKQHDLLAMPSIVLANGIPPQSQLRGSYGGSKKSVKEEVMKAVEKKLKGGKNLSGMTDKRADMSGGKNLSGMTDKRGIIGAGDGRKKRAEIVKRIMKEKGLKLIDASRFVKEHNLYKK